MCWISHTAIVFDNTAFYFLFQLYLRYLQTLHKTANLEFISKSKLWKSRQMHKVLQEYVFVIPRWLMVEAKKPELTRETKIAHAKFFPTKKLIVTAYFNGSALSWCSQLQHVSPQTHTQQRRSYIQHHFTWNRLMKQHICNISNSTWNENRTKIKS